MWKLIREYENAYTGRREAERRIYMIPVEAIERVIDDLETKRETADGFIDNAEPQETITLAAHTGAKVAFEYAIQELRKVLSDYAR